MGSRRAAELGILPKMNWESSMKCTGSRARTMVGLDCGQHRSITAKAWMDGWMDGMDELDGAKG